MEKYRQINSWSKHQYLQIVDDQVLSYVTIKKKDLNNFQLSLVLCNQGNLISDGLGFQDRILSTTQNQPKKGLKVKLKKKLFFTLS